MHSLSLSQQLEVLNNFLAYLYFDKGVSPRYIGNFLAAVRFKFQTQNAIADFLNPSYTQRFLQGARLQEAQLGVRHDKKRPMPFSMIRSLLETQLDPLCVTDRPYRISVLMAYFFLLR